MIIATGSRDIIGSVSKSIIINLYIYSKIHNLVGPTLLCIVLLYESPDGLNGTVPEEFNDV